MDRIHRRAGARGVHAIVLLAAACTSPNPNYGSVTIGDGGGGDRSGSDVSRPDAGGVAGAIAGQGGLPDDNGTGGVGGANDGGSDLVAPDDVADADDAGGMIGPPGSPEIDGPVDLPGVVDTAPPDVTVAFMDVAVPAADVAANPDVETPADAASAVNGLRGDYYSGQNFEQFVFTRIDAQINWNWVSTGPDPRLAADNFSVRWTGYVEPRYTGIYTFSTVTDDGVRLWIDGVNHIDKWNTQSGIEHTAMVELVAGRRVPIRMEFYDRAFTASAQLFWRSTAQAKEIVPFTRLWAP